MSKFNAKYSCSHKEIYNRLLDELDNKTIQKIMTNPYCEEGVLLNKKVEKEIESGASFSEPMRRAA